MKLARTVAHTTDVDGMLAQMTPEQFNEWWAMYQVEPWGIEAFGQEEAKPKGGGLSAMRAVIGV